jgi:hypothetical protein
MFRSTAGPSSRASRAGFALPAAILGLVVVGVLVTGGFYVARQQGRIGIANKMAGRAFYMAELGVAEVMDAWDASLFSGSPNLTQITFSDTLSYGFWQVTATKTSDWHFFLDGSGTVTQGGGILGGASRRVGLMTRLATAQIDPPAALTTRGDVSIRGGAEVSGLDIVPPGWTCPADRRDKTGVLTDLDGSVSTNGGGSVDGAPPTDQSDEVTDSTFTQFGDLSWDELVAMADLSFGGGNFNGMSPSFTADGSCNTGDTSNWGDPVDPTSACGSYFPIIHVNGTALVQSNAVGQGILLVEGDLDLRGTFIFSGIVIVQGNFETQGSGHRIYGAVMASNADLDRERIVGSSVVQNSTCAVTRAVLLNGSLTRLRALDERSWVDLSNLEN